MQSVAERRPLSLAKLTAPQPHRAWPRRRLFESLDAARRRGNLVWIAAPAGSGKTVLVASYLQARRLRAVWYRIDAADSDAASFFHDLGLAARGASGRRKEAMPTLAAEYREGLPVFARNWFRRFYERIDGVPLLVCDDYHELAADSPVHLAMREALAEVPPGLTVIVVSRTEPPPVLTRLRTLDTFTLLDRDALRLSADESVEIARQRLPGNGLDDAALRTLHERTRGWLAGLVLLLERGPQVSAAEVASPGDPLVFDYFAGELLAQSEPRLQRFMFQTALPPRITAHAAAALTGTADAAGLLAELDRRNFFVTRHRAAGLGDTYEYHPLFRQFLLEQGRRQLAPEELTAAKREAAALLARDGDVAAAMALLRETGDWAELIGLVLEQAPGMFREGRVQTLAGWIGEIPAAQRASVPWLGYHEGLCRLPFDPSQARVLLAEAYAGFRAQGNARGEYLAWAAIVDTFVYAWSDFGPADIWIDEFDALRKRHPRFPSTEIEVRAVAAIFAALSYRQPAHPELAAWTAHLDALLSQDIDPATRMTAGSQLVLYYNWWTGDMARANELVRRLDPFAGAREVGPFVRLAWEGILAISHWMNADNAAALAAVERGLALAGETGAHVWDFMLLGQGTIAAAISGQLELAQGYLERLRQRVVGERRLDGVQYHFFAFQLAAQRDDLAAMREHAPVGLRCAEQAGVVWGEVYTRPALAQVLFLDGDAAGAQRELDAALAIARSIGCSNARYYVHELEARFAQASGDRQAELVAIAALFAVMREQGFGNSAWWRDAVMARLCRVALEHGIEPAFVRELIRRRGLLPDEPAARLESWPWPVRVRVLGTFAIDIDGAPLRFTGKVQKRPLELLKALVALGGRGVAEAQLAEALWPDAEGDDAHNAFVTTLQRLRKLLGQREALLLQEGRLSLNPRLCWVDAWAFESVDPDGGAGDDLRRVLDVYRGDLCAADDASWAIAPRERLRARFVRAADTQVRQLMDAGRWEDAIADLERALRVDATVEVFYQQLMRCQARLGRSAEVASTYRRCREVLAAALQVRPAASTEALLKALAGT